jgi:hypothetical protein
MVWNAAVKATLEDVARDLEAHLGVQKEAQAYAEENAFDGQAHRALIRVKKLRELIDRYNAAAKELP